MKKKKIRIIAFMFQIGMWVVVVVQASFLCSCSTLCSTSNTTRISLNTPKKVNQKCLPQESTVETFLANQKQQSQQQSLIPIHPTLLDDPSLGKLYLLQSKKVDIFEHGIQLRVVGGGEDQNIYVIPNCFIVDLELTPVGKGENFHFDDCEGIHGKVYSSIRDSQWFRIKFPKPNKKSDVYVIRGFDRTGRCVYYKEWSQPIFGAILDKNSGKTAERKPERKLPMSIPKMMLPSTER